MRAYFDASAIVKLVLAERGEEVVDSAIADSDVQATSLLSYAECRAAFSRAARDRRITLREEKLAAQRFERTWDGFTILEIDQALVHAAADLAREFSLRPSDAIHLATGVTLTNGHNREAAFVCFDNRLLAAAGAAGFQIVLP